MYKLYNSYMYSLYSLFQCLTCGNVEGRGSLDPGGYAFASWPGWCATAASAGCNSQGWKSAVAHGLSNEVPGWKRVEGSGQEFWEANEVNEIASVWCFCVLCKNFSCRKGVSQIGVVGQRSLFCVE